jgi:hypothetical protein
MIQLAPDGNVPFAPSKSSLQTVVHPAGGVGTLACAATARAPVTRSGASNAVMRGRERIATSRD